MDHIISYNCLIVVIVLQVLSGYRSHSTNFDEDCRNYVSCREQTVVLGINVVKLNVFISTRCS